jgi:hypothetical protein
MNVMSILRPELPGSLRLMSAIHSMNERDIHRLLQSMFYFFLREVGNEGFVKGGWSNFCYSDPQRRIS